MNNKDVKLLLFGISTTFIGLGIGRFAFASLMPEMILAEWFSDTEASYIGTANLLGYLVGALIASKAITLAGAQNILMGSVVSIALSYILCFYPSNYYWFMVWRFIAGVGGALLVVLGPSLSLSLLSKESQAIGGNLIFTGIGFGILLSTAIAPITQFLGLSFSWLFLGILACLLIPFIISTIRNNGLNKREITSPPKKVSTKLSGRKGILLLIAAYGMDAIGYVPHTVFWVDYLAREQGFGTYAASVHWMLFGIGAILGPALLGMLTQQLGWNKALLLAFTLKTVGIALPVFSSHFLSYTISSLLVGAMLPCVVALVSGSLYARVGAVYHKQYWAMATFTFAVLQATSGYTMSLWYSEYASYQSLFIIATLFLSIGTLLAALSIFMEKEARDENETFAQ